MQYCAISGAAAGVVTSLFSSPVELTRLKLQIPEPGTNYSGSLDATVQIYRNYGMASMYKGYVPTLCRELLGYTMYFSYYKKAMEGVTENRFQWSMFHGGMAGLANWMTAYPFDVVKSKMQNDSMSSPSFTAMRQAFLSVFREGGIRAFYRGYSVVIVRAFPTNSGGFLAYETALSMLGHRQAL